MKRWMVFLLALALLIPAGCAKGGPIGVDPASLIPNVAPTEAPATDAPEPIETQPATEAPTDPTESEAPTEAPTEPVKLDITDAYALFTLSREESGTYTVKFDDDYSYDSSYVYEVPRFAVNTPGAQSINAKLEERFLTEVDAALTDIKDGIGSSLMEVNWFVSIWENRISLIVYESYDWSEELYEVYYYDAVSGAEITAAEMLALTGLAESDFLNSVREGVRESFIEKYEWIDEADRADYGYDAMLAMADGDEIINMELVKFYVYSDGDVYVYAPVPSLAGASYYYEEFWLDLED